MGNQPSRLADCYAEARRLGDELLELVRPPMRGEGIDQIAELIAKREAALELAGELLAQGAQLGELRSELKALLDQQKALEVQLERQVGFLRTEAVKAQVTRAHIAGVHRVLGGDVKPRMIDQRR